MDCCDIVVLLIDLPCCNEIIVVLCDIVVLNWAPGIMFIYLVGSTSTGDSLWLRNLKLEVISQAILHPATPTCTYSLHYLDTYTACTVLISLGFRSRHRTWSCMQPHSISCIRKNNSDLWNTNPYKCLFLLSILLVIGRNVPTEEISAGCCYGLWLLLWVVIANSLAASGKVT